jgi:D-alanyl-D-alanine carboxypeptidase
LAVRVRENRAVGIVAAVVRGNDTLLLKAYGKAVVESDSPATVDTVFQIGSDTKQFTAAAILQLRDQGKLTLDDDITKWLPDFETRGNKITCAASSTTRLGSPSSTRCRSFARRS